MKREIYDPFAELQRAESSSDGFKSESLSIDSHDVCPKCGGSMVDASIGGHGNVMQASVKYCTSCRVSMPVADQT